MTNHVVVDGLGFGSVMAMIISYAHNPSILWMFIHGVLSWLYVIWVVLGGGR
jgi:maltodextrin utilization protein YvdJ